MNATVVAALLVGVGTVLAFGHPGLALPCAALACATGVVPFVVRRRVVVLAAAGAVLVFAAAASASWRSVATGEALVPKLAKSEAVVRACGTVQQLGPHSAELRVERLARRGRAWRVREPVRVAGKGAEHLAPGEDICAAGALRPARAGHDEPPVMLADTLDREGTGSRIRRAAGAVRKRFSDAAVHALPKRQAGLLLGMTDGDTALIDGATTEDFRTTGLAHLVAVSGYNVAVFLAIVMVAVRAVVRRGRFLRVAFALPALVFFAFLTGLEPSVLRATVSAGVVLVATAGGRMSEALRAAALAFSLLILASPEMLFAPGFQLSFAATLGIILWSEPIAQRIVPRATSRVARAVASGLATTIAAQFAVAPLLAWHFGRIPGLGGLANLVAIPLGGFVMLGGLSTLSIASVLPALDWAPATMRLPLDAILASAHAFARVPAASVTVGVVTACAITAIVAAFAATSLRARSACVALGVVFVGVASGQAIGGPSCPDAFVAALDVGQGSAVLLRSGDHSVLVDAGPPGGRVVEQIRATGVDHLDALFVTHSHMDHALGALDVIHRMRVGHLLGPKALLWASGAQVIRAARSADIPYDDVAANDSFDFGAIGVRIMWPPDDDLPSFSQDAIDANSLVLRAEIAGTSVLLPGDIRSEQQQALTNEDVSVPVLVAPHHGSKDLDPDFVAGVSPRVTLITVGAPNPYGLPAPEAVRAYASRGPVLRTDQDGRVTLCLDDTGARVVKER